MDDLQLSVRIGIEPPLRLDKALARDVPVDAALSRTRLTRLINEGRVTSRGQVITNPKLGVVEGDIFEITVPVAAESHIGPEDIPLDILYEDNDLIVINKAVGMVVHPAPGTPNGTLVNALLHHCGDTLSGVGGSKRPGIVHRIDKETSGLLVVAKSDAAHHGLSAQFAKHTVKRYYLAVVYGVPDANDPRVRGVKGVSFEAANIMRVTTQLARHKHDRQRQAVLFQGGRHALTRVRIVETFGTPIVASLVECWLETGRTHQIRVHLNHTGHGLIGDPTYGGKRKLSPKALPIAAINAAREFPRQALHAASLGFDHPISGEFISFAADTPPDMTALLDALRMPKKP